MFTRWRPVPAAGPPCLGTRSGAGMLGGTVLQCPCAWSRLLTRGAVAGQQFVPRLLASELGEQRSQL